MGPNLTAAVPSASFYQGTENLGYMSLGEAPTSPAVKCKNVFNKNIVKTNFFGIWSIYNSNSFDFPCQRTGQFSVYDDAHHLVYVGYGINYKQETLNDLWCLNTLTRQWRKIELHGDKISGRSGARASLIGTHLLIFGGYSEPNYFADPHTIDVLTGEVKMISTSGKTPEARSTPLVAIYGNKFYVWGGFNGKWPTELNVLDFSNMCWKQFNQGVTGRTAVPSVIYGNKLYSYGGSKSGGMLQINFDTNVIEMKQTIGSEPPSGVMGAGMVIIEHYAIYFGGKTKSEYNLIYCCDLNKMWWFIFYILPDGKTVFPNDGKVNDIGVFLVPRIHSFGLCYVKERREVLAFFGNQSKNSSPLFIVYVGDAFSCIHHQEDMLDMLKYRF